MIPRRRVPNMSGMLFGRSGPGSRTRVKDQGPGQGCTTSFQAPGLGRTTAIANVANTFSFFFLISSPASIPPFLLKFVFGSKRRAGIFLSLYFSFHKHQLLRSPFLSFRHHKGRGVSLASILLSCYSEHCRWLDRLGA